MADGTNLFLSIGTPVFWPGEFPGLYSPWGRKELDLTERLSLKTSNKETRGGKREK